MIGPRIIREIGNFCHKKFTINPSLVSKKINSTYTFIEKNLRYIHTTNIDVSLNSSKSKEVVSNSGVWQKTISDRDLELHEEELDRCAKLLAELFKRKYGASRQNELILSCRNKILGLSILLECSPEVSYLAMVKHKFLLNSKISTLETKVAVITGCGITLAHLKKDLWVLSYTISRLQERINKIKTLNLPIRCWMLRCELKVLERIYENREENKAALNPFNTPLEYLCDRLKMNETQLSTLSNKYPPVLKIKMAKLREVLEYLLFKGFTPAQIYASPRILCYRVSTVKERVTLLEKANAFYSPPLHVLCKSKKMLEAYAQKVAKFSNPGNNFKY